MNKTGREACQALKDPPLCPTTHIPSFDAFFPFLFGVIPPWQTTRMLISCCCESCEAFGKRLRAIKKVIPNMMVLLFC